MQNLILYPILACLALIWAPKMFFDNSIPTRCQTLLHTTISCNFKENLCTENGKKSYFGPDFDPFWLKFGPKKNLLQVLFLLNVIHFCKLSLYATSRKTNIPNLKKWGKYTSFGSYLGHFGPNLGPKSFLCGFYLYQMLDIVACNIKKN